MRNRVTNACLYLVISVFLLMCTCSHLCVPHFSSRFTRNDKFLLLLRYRAHTHQCTSNPDLTSDLFTYTQLLLPSIRGHDPAEGNGEDFLPSQHQTVVCVLFRRLYRHSVERLSSRFTPHAEDFCTHTKKKKKPGKNYTLH